MEIESSKYKYLHLREPTAELFINGVEVLTDFPLGLSAHILKYIWQYNTASWIPHGCVLGHWCESV